MFTTAPLVSSQRGTETGDSEMVSGALTDPILNFGHTKEVTEYIIPSCVFLKISPKTESLPNILYIIFIMH